MREEEGERSGKEEGERKEERGKRIKKGREQERETIKQIDQVDVGSIRDKDKM